MPCVGWGHLDDEFGVKDGDDHICQTVEGVDSMTILPTAVKNLQIRLTWMLYTAYTLKDHDVLLGLAIVEISISCCRGIVV